MNESEEKFGALPAAFRRFPLKKTRLIDLRNECNLNKTRLSFLINWAVHSANFD